MSNLRDEEPFVEIQVDKKPSGIYVKLGSKGKVLNYSDAQFLCDALYVLLDDLRLDEEESDGTTTGK